VCCGTEDVWSGHGGKELRIERKNREQR
jgi:hypothetical protein